MIIPLFTVLTIAFAIGSVVYFAEQHSDGVLEWYEAIPAMVLMIIVWPIVAVILGIRGILSVVGWR